MELKNYFAQDSHGEILADATCYLYQAGLQIPAVDLRDANDNPLSNPFNADSDGLIQFKAPNGLYDLRVLKGGRDYKIRIQCNGVDGNVQVARLAAPDGAWTVGYGELTAGAVLDRLRSHEINVLDYGADNTGTVAAHAQLTQAWTKVREALREDRYCSVTFKVPPGVYLIDETVDWTAAFAWNLNLDARGAVFIGRTTGRPVIDMTGVRGLSSLGLGILGHQDAMPLCGLVVGPGMFLTCGNNSFEGLKTDGYFDLTAVLNIGSETTPWKFCYFQNRAAGKNRYAFIGDSLNRFGFSSEFTTTRAPLNWASLTCNTFIACRAANYADGPATYIEGVFNWAWDIACYHLSFADAGIVIRCSGNTIYKTTNLEIRGLFETAGSYGANDPTYGMQDCVRIVVDEGLQTDIRSFYLNAGMPQCGRSVLRVENTAGATLSSGALKLRNADIIVATTVNRAYSVPLFSGELLYVQGDIKCTDSAMVNLNALELFQGSLYTKDYGAVSKPTATNKAFAFTVFDETSEGGRVVRITGVGNAIALNPATKPRIKAIGSDANIDLDLVAQGSGGVRINGAAASMGSELLTVPGSASFSAAVGIGSYYMSTRPSAAANQRGLIIVLDASDGTALCRSNGTDWIDLMTKQPVA